MTEYYLTFEEFTYEISPPEKGEGDWLYQGESGVEVTPLELFNDPPDEPYEIIHDNEYTRAIYGLDEIPVGQTAYVVLVNYTDGDTFGASGYWCIAAVKSTAEKALDAVEKCNNPDSDDEYRSWEGYFAHLNSVNVVPMVVQTTKSGHDFHRP